MRIIRLNERKRDTDVSSRRVHLARGKIRAEGKLRDENFDRKESTDEGRRWSKTQRNITKVSLPRKVEPSKTRANPIRPSPD